MKQIKFSYLYEKMNWQPKTAKLLQVLKVNYNDLSEGFVAYDTAFHEDYGMKYYSLPKTDLILLILFDLEREIIWTTIRRFTPKKWEYYKGSESEVFDIVLPLRSELLITSRHSLRSFRRLSTHSS